MITERKSRVYDRLCSRMSKIHGEDPIGSAPSWDHCLIVEVDKPWTADIISSKHFPTGISDALEGAENNNISIKLQAIERDPEYSVDGHYRVMFYSRPAKQFAMYDKDEFVAPMNQIGALTQALLESPNDLRDFERFRVEPGNVRDIFVCTHGTHDVCCGTFGFPVFKALRNDYTKALDGSLRAWRISHTGGHRLAPNLIDMPEGRYWARIGIDHLDTLVHHQNEASTLRAHYRGWTGLGTGYEKTAERDAFMSEGWNWTKMLKSSVLISENPSDAKVRIDFRDPITNEVGAYEALVESKAVVIKANCMEIESTDTVPQYGVTNLTRLI
ncbi:sucrase ferredoxin [Dehalococcoidia bacterium]|nr:sucrase ferredoxin [Dehalococcoidia bacterium]